MKGSDKAIVMGVIMAIVLVAFYVKVLSPKREKASSLQKDIAELQVNLDQQKQAAAFGEDARRHFPTYYGHLVVMGKAVPADSDTASLLVQLNGIAERNHLRFDVLQIDDTTGTADPSATATPPAAPPAATASSGTSTTSTTPSSTGSSAAATPAATTTPTPATEATAANLPLGASVGTAGLPTMPYHLTFVGHYFDVADFLQDVDGLVHVHGTDQVAADGRLLTINGFAMKVPDSSTASNPKLKVNLVVTSYLTPGDQGLTAGASPTTPAPSLTQPASATVSP